MRLSVWQFIFYLSLVFACGYANAGSIVTRQADDNGPSALSRYVNKFIDMSRKVPWLGNSIAGFLQWSVQAISLFEIGTNGAIARFLGGALPCTVSLDGTSCSGLTNNGGFAAVLMSVLDGIPTLVLPGFAKSFLALLIQIFIDPTMDVIFGGVVVDQQ